MYGEGAVTDQTHQKWFVKFCAGDVPCYWMLDATPWSIRPVEVDNHQIKILIENNLRYAMWELDDICKISKSIKVLVKMKNLSYFMEKSKWTFWHIVCTSSSHFHSSDFFLAI